eukprot:TRINITY_DN5120_c0_g1_i3.p1 TRINITY_DN5120_c0_g1~~TRINITY_DN5120_c0_g1_i3.p1  ORF type:complete len:191 (-),score=26.16 TRINITY_DN5120_c0_g1_i3:53-625(-)
MCIRDRLRSPLLSPIRSFRQRVPAWSTPEDLDGWTYEAVIARWEVNLEHRSLMFGSVRAGVLKTLTPSKAWHIYQLTPRDTKNIPSMITHDADGDEYRLYTRFSLQDAAYMKYGTRKELDKAKADRNAKRSRRMAMVRLHGMPGLDMTPVTTGTRPLRGDRACLLYTSDAADEEDSVDLGGRRIIKKKKK